MNLVIDIGNTQIKLAIFDQFDLVYTNTLRHEAPEALMKWLVNEIAPYPITKSIISNVADISPQTLEQLTKAFPLPIFYTANTPVPIKNRYETPTSLGADRIPAVIGAWGLLNKQPSNVLVIDAGTCIKFNFLNNNNEFEGGYISPGLNMRYMALNTFTGKLPLMQQPSIPHYPSTLGWLGKSTTLSMQIGVEQGIMAEIETGIRWYEDTYATLKVFLTGGDHSFFEKRLKNPIFVDPYLVLRGLNLILLYADGE